MKKLILILAVLLTSIAFAQNAPPAIFYSDLTSGPNTGGVNNAGAFVTIHGNGFGATQGSSTVTVGGGAAASYQSWSNTAVTFQLGAAAKTGSIAISAGGTTSNSVPFTVRSGKIYFVSTSGSDTSAGSYSSPWKTLAHAASVMTAGSVTYVENGYTQSTELVLGRSGSTSSPLAILGYPGSSVTVGATTGLPTGVSITASNWVLANLILRGTQTAVSVGNVTGIRLAGSDISCPNATATGGCISTSGGSSFALLGNSIHNNASYQAVSLLNTNGVEIGWNLITNTLGCNAIGAHSSSALQYSYKVHDNYIYKTPCGAIALGTVNPSLGAVSVYNNIIQSSGTGPAPAGTSQSYGYAAIMIGGGSSTPAQVYNNTIYDAGGLGGESAGAVRALGAVNLTNNIFYLLSSEQYVSLDTTLSYLTGSNNLFYGAGSPLGIFSDSVAGDPMFAGLTANNFHLSAGSPAIDSGATVQLATDYDGVPRPQGPAYDIGAYEYPEASGAGSATPVSTTATPAATSATPAAVTATPAAVTATPTAATATPAATSATPAATKAKGGTHSNKTPAVSLSPTSLTFASQTVGTTSAAQTITLKNAGTAALAISQIAASSSFAETNTCGTSLAASASCTISVTFTPTAAGTPTGSISITDNAAASPQAVSLSGTGAGAASTLAITTTSLPSGVVGTAYSTTLAATGGTAPYTWTDPSCSGSCNTGMSFTTAGVLSGTPVNAGTSTFTMTVADSAGHTATKQLSITIAAAAASTPAVSLSPTSLTFTSQTVGTTSAAQTVTLKNTGAGALSISSIAASGNFAETTACPSSLPAGASCTISVTFTPTAAGTPTGSISITDNAAASPQAVSLSGTAVAAASTLTIASTSLPAGTVGTAYSATLAATGGTAPYTWTDPSCSGACNTGMTFSSAGVLSGTPVNAGTSTFTFTVADSASHTASAQLSITIAAGAASTPAVSLSPTSLTFASQTVGTTSAAQTVTLKNTGAGTLSISSIAASAGFAETNTCGTSLAASASCTISVTFTPTAAGTPTGSISITDNAAASPQAVSLSGTAVAAAASGSSGLTITTASLPTGTVGTAYSTTLVATGGTAPYTWTDPSCSGACNTGMTLTSAGVFSGTPTNAGTSTFTFTVTDSAGNTASAQLSITIAAAATGSSGSGAPSVALSWTAPSGTVSGYDVFRSSQSGTGYTLVNSGLVSGSSYTDTSVSAGQTYYYVVTSVNSSGVQSSYSSQVTATVPAS